MKRGTSTPDATSPAMTPSLLPARKMTGTLRRLRRTMIMNRCCRCSHAGQETTNDVACCNCCEEGVEGLDFFDPINEENPMAE